MTTPMVAGAADILAFVEDPGAANMIAGLVPALARGGCALRTVASGTAVGQTQRLGAEALREGEDASALLARHAPSLVLVGTSENPDSVGLALIDEARTRGIATVGIVDGPANAAHRFRGRGSGARAHAPDWVLVPDAATRGTFLRLGFAGDRVAAVGHPQIDRARDARAGLQAIGREALRTRHLPNAPAYRPVIAFLAELSDGLDPAQFRRSPEYTLAGRGDSDLRTDIVLEEVLDAVRSLEPRPYIVLRLHPKNGADEFIRYAGEIDRVSRDEAAWDLLYGCDLVVGMTTMLLAEAAVLGLPTLAVLPRACERDWLITIASGTTALATTGEEIASAMAAAVQGCIRRDPAGLDAVLPPGATERIATFLASRCPAGADEARVLAASR